MWKSLSMLYRRLFACLCVLHTKHLALWSYIALPCLKAPLI